MAAGVLAPPSPRSLPWQVVKIGLLPLALACAIIAGVGSGPTTISLSNAAGIVLSQLGLPFGHTWPAWQVDIIWNIRLPEVVSAALIGCALSVAGAILQAALRNPLADPFVIGTSSGAVFGVSLAYWVFAPSAAVLTTGVWMGFGLQQVFSFGGALAAVGLVFALSFAGRYTGALAFLLAGFAVSTLMIAGMWFVAYQGGHVNLILAWMMGTLATSSWSQLTIVAPVILVLSALTLYFVRDLNALLLGDEQASYLGLSPNRSRIVLVVIATVITALSVSLAGVIGFVGLVIPHICRLVYGANHRVLLLASAFAGATFLVLCDILARTVEGGGGELPLGIITAIVGVPVFLFLLLRMGDAYAF